MRSRVVIVVLAWAALAAAAGAAGLVARSPVPPPAIVGGLVFAGIAAYWSSEAVREGVRAIPLAALVSIHLVRFVGAWFLVLYRRGELPFAFAIPGGWGDILAAAGAAGILAGAVPARNRARRAVVLAWNALAFLDILYVVSTAAGMFLAEPGALGPLTRFPLSLLPTFFVPLIVLSHLRIFGALRDSAREA